MLEGSCHIDAELVSRAVDPSDRRRRVLALTAAGRRLVTKLVALTTQNDDELLASLPGPDRETFRGTLLAEPVELPWAVVEVLGSQLGVAELSCVTGNAARLPTQHEHAREIREECGYRDFAEAGHRLTDGTHCETAAARVGTNTCACRSGIPLRALGGKRSG